MSSGLGRWGGRQNLGAPPLPTDYFSEHLGVYRPVLAALESLNRAVLAAMDTTKLVSERADGMGRGPKMSTGCLLRWASLHCLRAMDLERWIQIPALPLSVCALFPLWASVPSSVNWG